MYIISNNNNNPYSKKQLNQPYESIIPQTDSFQQVQLFLSGRNLADLDFFSKSDPYIKISYKRSSNQKQTNLGRSQTINNQLNPNWKKSFIVNYIFQATQQIKFQVYDQDDGHNDQFIGMAKTTIGALAGAKSQTTILDLTDPNKNNKKKLGKLIVRLQPVQDSNKFIQMKWKARKLLNTDSWFDFWDKSDPYLKLLKIRSDNTLIQASRTQIVMDNLNPNWKQIEVQLGKIINLNSNNNQQNNKFKIQCWDWEQQGQNKHQFIGGIQMNIDKLSAINKFPVEFALSNPKKSNPGYIILQKFSIISRPSFMDYLRGGLQLNLITAIDFTGSNGIPTYPTSLHYMNPLKPNQYQIVLDSVLRILLNYDSDKRIPAFGFGAKPHYPLMNSSVVSHCFQLSGNAQQIQAVGYQHLMSMYNYAIQNVQLSGPTYFGAVIKQAINIARVSKSQGSNSYQILLILTDGEIHDMDETINLLVNNCDLPLSIIIVGIGNAEFNNMVKLDGDNGLVNNQGRKAQRDIVQFVPFRDVQFNSDRLAQQLLAELPQQVVQYMNLIKKLPNPPLQFDLNNHFNPEQQNIPQTEDGLKKNIADMILNIGGNKGNIIEGSLGNSNINDKDFAV